MKLALWQTGPQSRIDDALDALAEEAGRAYEQGADLLVTPEMFLGGYNIGADQVAAHADVSEPALERLKAIAKAEDIALVVGMALPGRLRPHNACIAIDRTGKEVARYHKTHLYGDVDRAQFTAGDALPPVFDLDGWRVALAICYDIEFPELVRSLALRGAELVVCPTANMVPFHSVATRIVPARAEENAICVAYCNYVGSEGQFTYNGLSCVVGPDGADLVRGGEAGGLLFATLDKDALLAAREVQTHLNDRRADLYKDFR